MPLPFRQPSCGLRSSFETVLKGSEKVKLHARNQRQGRRHHRCELRKHSRAGSGIGGTPNAFASKNPKQFRISKSKLRKANFRVEKLPFRSLFLLNFEFVSNFEIRHSDLLRLPGNGDPLCEGIFKSLRTFTFACESFRRAAESDRPGRRGDRSPI